MPTTNPIRRLIPGWNFSTFLALFILFTWVQGSSSLKDEQEKRHRFESLLASGRTLAFPFSTGFILAVVGNGKGNWNVSETGIEEAVGLSPESLFQSYSSLVKDMKEDDNLTVSSTLYHMHQGKDGNYSKGDESLSSSRFKLLETGVKHVVWDNSTWNETWHSMDKYVSDSTNGIMAGKLIPKETSLGSPFPFSTESVIVSTLHYRNDWVTPWTEGGLHKFQGSETVPYLRMRGEYLISEEEDFTAVSIPLEGERKSIVFVLPNVNITKYFRSRSQDHEEEADSVPFPKTWVKKPINVLVPEFNVTSIDQYGQELEQLGLNETFCTTFFDRRGKFPYYLRPIVQANAIAMSGKRLEIASATGTAIEKFHLGLDIGGKGYPKLKSQVDSNTEESTTTLSTNEPVEELATEAIQLPELRFNRPFLFYLNDTKVGPMFYGIVQNIGKDEDESEPEDESKISKAIEAEKFILWSCKSFKQSGEIGEGEVVVESS